MYYKRSVVFRIWNNPNGGGGPILLAAAGGRKCGQVVGLVEELQEGGQKEEVDGRQEGSKSPNLIIGLVKKELLDGGQEPRGRQEV